MYTREQLIEICEKAIVPFEKWNDRDTSSAQLGVGQCLSLLKSGCKFEIQTKENTTASACITDDETIWIQFYVRNFIWFEYHYDDEDRQEGIIDNDCHFYLPTPQRLEMSQGNDWY